MKKLTKKNYDEAKYSPHDFKRIGWKKYYFECTKCGKKIYDAPLPAYFCGYEP